MSAESGIFYPYTLTVLAALTKPSLFNRLLPRACLYAAIEKVKATLRPQVVGRWHIDSHFDRIGLAVPI
jgi:hypothetical protein